MSEPRYRYSGRRSPTYNPARASMPVGVGYNPHYSGDLHTVQTGHYNSAVPRRVQEHKTSSTPTTTVTTYNVTKDPPPPPPPVTQRTSNTARRRSSTVDSAAVKPIIVTTNHATRPHGSSSHTSSAARATSPSRDPYRSSDETYYTQPASSIPSTRGQHRHTHGYTQSATLSNDEFYRLRERVGDDRLRPPQHTATDYYRYSLPHANQLPHATFATPPHDLGAAVIDYENEGYEYTKPSDLARYDLDHDRQQRGRSRRESTDRSNDRPYYRPTVNVVSNEPGGRFDGQARGRGPPPPSSGLERYNRAAASGLYDRPTVTMPALLPPVPAAPPVDPLRRIEAPPRDAQSDERVERERRTTRPRPVSLYQDAPARMSHSDDLYRSHDDERVHRRSTQPPPPPPLTLPSRTERDDGYRDDDVTNRGFGIRTDKTLELPVDRSDRPARSVDRRDYDDRRSVRRDVPGTAERGEPRRRSDESIDYSRQPTEHTLTRVDSAREPKQSQQPPPPEGLKRKNSLGGRFAAGLGAVAASMGLTAKEAASASAAEEERKVSPRRGRGPADEEEDLRSASRAGDRHKLREREREPLSATAERKSAPTLDLEDDGVSERRRETRRGGERERAGSVPPSAKDRELERERVRERAYERERERERDQQREAEEKKERGRDVGSRDRSKSRDRERDRDVDRRDAEAKLNGLAVPETRDDAPASDEAAGASRRRRPNSASFDPTDTADLLNVKAELAAKDNQEKAKDKAAAKEPTFEKEKETASDRQSVDSREESRGRDLTPSSSSSSSSKEEKQVRVVSPPRDKSEHKPIKGILKPPKVKFPEEENPIREGVAPHKDDKSKKGVPPGARWTKINRKLINPAALEIGKERFEVRDDFVIVLRVLSKDEIQAYATATAQIRGMLYYHRRVYSGTLLIY